MGIVVAGIGTPSHVPKLRLPQDRNKNDEAIFRWKGRIVEGRQVCYRFGLAEASREGSSGQGGTIRLEERV
jgi:hypothetical protein